MPRRDDDEFALAAERDRVAAGLEDYAPDDVPPAADRPAPGVSETDWFGGARVVGRHLNRHAGPLAQCCGFDAPLSDTLESSINLERTQALVPPQRAAHVGFRGVG